MQGLSSSLTSECGQWKFLTSVQFDNIVVIVWGSQAVPTPAGLGQLGWEFCARALRFLLDHTQHHSGHQVVQEVNLV